MGYDVNKPGVKVITATHPKLKMRQMGLLNLSTNLVTFCDGLTIPKTDLNDLEITPNVKYKPIE